MMSSLSRGPRQSKHTGPLGAYASYLQIGDAVFDTRDGRTAMLMPSAPRDLLPGMPEAPPPNPRIGPRRWMAGASSARVERPSHPRSRRTQRPAYSLSRVGAAPMSS